MLGTSRVQPLVETDGDVMIQMVMAGLTKVIDSHTNQLSGVLDGDGFGDNPEGHEGDACQTSEANRSLTGLDAEIQMVTAGPTPHKIG